MIIPDEYDVYDFTPLDRPAGSDGMSITHFDRSVFYNVLPKIEVIGNDALTLFKRLGDSTGVKISDGTTRLYISCSHQPNRWGFRRISALNAERWAFPNSARNILCR